MENDIIKGSKYLEDLLTREDGTMMSVKEAVKYYGNRGVWIAALNSEIRDKLRRPRLKGYPPRIFISYRWESEEHKAWVRKLASRLRERGFEVLLDQFQSMEGSRLNVPKYVSSIAECHYFVIIITSGYCEVVDRSGKGPDGWVFDEYQTALSFSKGALIKIICILKEGKKPPPGCGKLIDLRNVKDSFSVIDEVFHYEGPVLSHEEQEELVSLIESIKNMISTGNYGDALSKLEQHRKYSETLEYRRMLSTVYAGIGKQNEAIEMAESILREYNLDPETLLQIGDVLSSCGMKKQALKCIVHLSKTEFDPARVHYLMGNILDDLHSFRAAINHLKYSVLHANDHPLILNDLGMVYRHDCQLEKAEDCFRRALVTRPEYELPLVNLIATLCGLGRTKEAEERCDAALQLYPYNTDLITLKAAISRGNVGIVGPRIVKTGIDYSCDHCGAIYHLDLKKECICGDCGTLYSGVKQRCPCCENDGVVPLELEFAGLNVNFEIACPICRKGSLTKSEETKAS